MESILSMHDEVYPVKSRRNKSSSYLRNSLQIRRSTLDQTTVLSQIYLYIRSMIAQRTLYILGILNLILAGIAILCVTHAEDHPEYFSLVYIAISIFIFYMLTILMIIIVQIIETYQEKNQRNQLQIPCISTQIPVQSMPIVVESINTATRPQTRLSRSHTLPLTTVLINPHQTFSTSTSSSVIKDSNSLTSHHYTLLPNTSRISLKLPRNYQSLALTTTANHPPYTTITNNDYTPQCSPLIKPIPMSYLINNENKKSKIQFSK